MPSYTIQTMLQAGVHFGHQTRYWNPKIKPYLYGFRHHIHIFNLGITYKLLQNALTAMRHIAHKKGKILFLGTKYAARILIKQEAERCGMPYINHRWLGGLLTNYKTIRQSIKRLKELESLFETNRFGRLTKKEILSLSREKDKLSNNLGGIKHMGGLPDALFVIDVGHEKIAIREANRLGIIVSGIVDSNNDPDGITYPIPGNDDASRAIQFYLALVADTILEAQAKPKDSPEENHTTILSIGHKQIDSPSTILPPSFKKIHDQKTPDVIQKQQDTLTRSDDTSHHEVKGENNDHHH